MNLGISPSDLALFVASLVAPFIINAIKAKGGLSGTPALYLAFGVSVVLGLGVAVSTGTPLPAPGNDPVAFTNEVLKLASVVFSLATLIYKTWLSAPPA